MIILQWPPKELNPNKKVHWRVKATAVKLYRDACNTLTIQARASVPEGDGPISMTIDFYPPDKRHRDDDNMISAFKAGRDGIADALSVNDRRFSPVYRFNDPIKGGKIVVTI